MSTAIEVTKAVGATLEAAPGDAAAATKLGASVLGATPANALAATKLESGALLAASRQRVSITKVLAAVLLENQPLELTKALAAIVLLGGKVSTNGGGPIGGQVGLGLMKTITAVVLAVPASVANLCVSKPIVKPERTCSFTKRAEC